MGDLVRTETPIRRRKPVFAVAGLFDEPSAELRSSRSTIVSVKDLVVGSGIAFEEHGDHMLKGVPGVWDVFAVVSC
jgi:hypothetical protein